MNKAEYMRQLKKNLRRLPKEDLEKAVEYYEEYFADAGIENEAQAIKDLGYPDTAAEQIIRNIAASKAEEPVKSVKRGLSTLWIVILALFALPIGLPLVIMIAVVILMFVFCILMALFFCIVAGVLLVVSGLMLLIGGFIVLPVNVPSFIFCFGAGMALAGIGLIFTYSMIMLCRASLGGTIRLFAKMTRRRGNQYE